MNFHYLDQELLSSKKLGYMNSAFDIVFYTMFSRFDGIIIRMYSFLIQALIMHYIE